VNEREGGGGGGESVYCILRQFLCYLMFVVLVLWCGERVRSVGASRFPSFSLWRSKLRMIREDIYVCMCECVRERAVESEEYRKSEGGKCMILHVLFMSYVNALVSFLTFFLFLRT